MRLHELSAKGANKNRKRVGRGESSGYGKTAGKGAGGQKKRSGKGKPMRGFEGGQNPMWKRTPKRGFTNIFAIPTGSVNIDILDTHFDAGEEVTMDACKAKGLISNRAEKLRILGRGEISKALTITAHHFTKTAMDKVTAASGTANVIAVASKS